MFEQPTGLMNYTFTVFPDGRGAIGVRGIEGTEWQHIELLVDWDTALP